MTKRGLTRREFMTIACAGLAMAGIVTARPAAVTAAGWKAGVAKISITPTPLPVDEVGNFGFLARFSGCQ